MNIWGLKKAIKKTRPLIAEWTQKAEYAERAWRRDPKSITKQAQYSKCSRRVRTLNGRLTGLKKVLAVKTNALRNVGKA